MTEKPEHRGQALAEAYRRDPEAFRRMVRETVRRLAEACQRIIAAAVEALRRVARAYAEHRARLTAHRAAGLVPARPVETMSALRPIAYRPTFTGGAGFQMVVSSSSPDAHRLAALLDRELRQAQRLGRWLPPC